MLTELATFRAAHPRLVGASLRSASKSFQQGMAARVADRLNEMHRERDASVAAQRSTGTALVLVKHQVVEVRSDTPRSGSFQLGGCALRGGTAPSGMEWLPAIAST